MIARRFRCDAVLCGRQIFTERFAEGVLAPSAHHHLCLPSILEIPDSSDAGDKTQIQWNAIDSVHIRSWKKTLGAQFRLALATALQERGYAIDLLDDDDWRWSIRGVPSEVCRFFSARRATIEEELSNAGVTSTAAPALAAAITLRSRREKSAGGDLTQQWRDATEQLGYEPDAIVQTAKAAGRAANRELSAERRRQLIRARLEPVPGNLVRNQATFERRHLLEAVANALVGTKATPDRVHEEAKQLLAARTILTLGETRDGPVHSTPEMVAIERGLVATATRLAADRVDGPDPGLVARLAAQEGLSAEQVAVAQAATSGARLVAVLGIAGSGKSAALRVVAQAWASKGFRVCAGSVTWRAARTLGRQLGVESRAIDSWLARAEAGQPVFDSRTVVLIDEAALQSSPQSARLLSYIERSGGLAVCAGDNSQLLPVGPGHAMRLIREAIGAVTLQAIIRQRAPWARDMVHAFARGDAKAGLDALVSRRLLTLHKGPKATVNALVDAWEDKATANATASVALIARTNAEVRAISAAVRRRLKQHGAIHGREIELPAVDASGHKFTMRLAAGDRIRFAERNDRLGVINGTEAVVVRIASRRYGDPLITVQLGARHVEFAPRDVADAKGRIKLAHGYALTLFQAQGITVDNALVLASSQLDRQSAYVAASRARDEVRLFADSRQIDSALTDFGQELGGIDRDSARLDYLARQFARESIKTTTLDAVNMLAAPEMGRQREHIKRRGLGHEL